MAPDSRRADRRPRQNERPPNAPRVEATILHWWNPETDPVRTPLPHFASPDRGRRLLCVDFDGTITERDVLASLITEHAREGWREFENAWRRGEISSVECMHGELGLLDMSSEEMDRYFASMPVDPDFAKFAAEAAAAGFHLEILSDGLDRYIHPILGRESLSHLAVICNTTQGEGSRLRIQPPYPVHCIDQAGNSKGHHIRLRRKEFDHVTLIGDGLSDRGAAMAADAVFAKGELRLYCEQQQIPHQGFHCFAQLRPGIAAVSNL